MHSDVIADLLQRCRQGDEQAARELFVHYARRLTRIADVHLNQKLAGREDGEDVVQSVFRTFFRRSAGGEFQFDSSEKLWKLLVQITLRKVRSRARYHTAEKRDVGAEEAGEAWWFEALADDPGPAEAAELMDLIGAVLKGLPPLYGQLLEMRMQGQEVADIATALRLSRQGVYRALDLLKERLARLERGAS